MTTVDFVRVCNLEKQDAKDILHALFQPAFFKKHRIPLGMQGSPTIKHYGVIIEALPKGAELAAEEADAYRKKEAIAELNTNPSTAAVIAIGGWEPGSATDKHRKAIQMAQRELIRLVDGGGTSPDETPFPTRMIRRGSSFGVLAVYSTDPTVSDTNDTKLLHKLTHLVRAVYKRYRTSIKNVDFVREQWEKNRDFKRRLLEQSPELSNLK